MDNNLPKNWVLSTLGEICTQPQYGYTTSGADSGTLRLLRTTDITSGKIDWDTVPFCEENPADEAKYLLEDGDIVISRAGSVGVSYLIQNPDRAVFASYLIRFRPFIDRSFFKYFLDSPFYWQQISENRLGIAVPNVNASKLQTIPIPIPPASEQQRIVAKIEELFSELDKGVENLKIAHEQLKVYRQVILKAAFEEHGGTETTLGNLLSYVTSGSRGWADYYSESGDLFIRAQNLKFDRLDLTECAYVSIPNKTEGTRTRVQKGDLLITITGANVTKAALVEQDLGTAYVSQHVALCRPIATTLPKFLYWYIIAECAGRKQLTAAAYGAGKPGLNLDNIKSVCLTIPSHEKQVRAVKIIEEKLSVCDELEQEIELGIHKAEALRQSILKKAFSGQLVAQDSVDEPASLLLERIKTQKEKISKIYKKVKKVDTAPRSGTIIPFPHQISSLTTTDLHAGIIALAYDCHEQNPRMLNTFGHVKAEKISHMVEYHLGITLGRSPVKDAAGPNDYRHLKKVEHRADKANWFNVQQRPGGAGYIFVKKRGFNGLLTKVSQALGDKAAEVEALIRLILPLNTQQAEIVATLYAAWNNLLISGISSPTDEDIVTEARENWHASKLNIERDKFFRALEWLRKKQLTPKGIGQLVSARGTS